MAEVFVVDGVRTAQGRYGGVLASVRPDDLGAAVLAEVVVRAGVTADAIDEVILGAANQAGEGWRIGDIDAVELNEAFAAQSLAVMRRLEREGGSRGLATLCVGVGQGVAMLVEAP